VIYFFYLQKSSFGGEGWIVGVDDLQDIIGGHVWLGSIYILGGIWHMLTKPRLLDLVLRENEEIRTFGPIQGEKGIAPSTKLG
jgi:hypothetical protein